MAENMNNTENKEVKETLVKKAWRIGKQYGPHWLGSMVVTLAGVLAFGALSEHSVAKKAAENMVTFKVGETEITQF